MSTTEPPEFTETAEFQPRAFPAFVACRFPEGTDPNIAGKVLSALTPRLMRWDDEVWLADLTPCRRYWQSLAQVLQVPINAGNAAAAPAVAVIECLRKTLVRAAAAAGSEEPSCIAFAPAPWPALLLATMMRVRRVSGAFDLLPRPRANNTFGRSLYEGTPWSIWAGLAQQITPHLTALKRPRFQPAEFKRQGELLLRAMKRLQSPGPFAIATASAAAMQRRFGSVHAALWDWTLKPADHAYEEAAPRGGLAFPWRPWQAPERAALTHHFEHAQWRWEELAPLLAEDLAKLARDPRFPSGACVTELTWRLILHDGERLAVPVAFRHPYDLRGDTKNLDAKGAGHTAVLQASYAFEAVMRREREVRESDFDLPLIGWELAISGVMWMPAACRDLFGALGDGSNWQELERLLDLENRLPLPLFSYAGRADWLPENSFVALVEGGAAAPGGADWVAVAAARPPYMTRTPLKLAAADGDARAAEATQLFLERLAGKWWDAPSSPASLPLHRDYYAWRDQKGRVWWGFRDEKAGWHRHGLFA